MALTPVPHSFTVGAKILASEHNNNWNTLANDYNGNITNANVAAGAGIEDTKLAQITTAGKVHGSSITGLASTLSGAGVLPSANTNLPLGGLMMWCTDTAPTGWILCDGTAYDAVASTEYQDLFDVIGNTFGGADNTDFQVPDMRGRFPLGQDDMGGASADRVTSAQADSVGGSGGSETISEAQLPAHTHSVAAKDNGISDAGSGNAISSNVSSGSITSGSTGSGTAYNQPFLTLNFIIRYA